MTDKESFEAWAIRLSTELGVDPPDLSVDARGFYLETELVAALECWKASRQQALRDETPARLKAWETAWDACRKQTIEECARACISGDADDCAAAIRSLTSPIGDKA